MIKPIIRSAQIISIHETCLGNAKKYQQKEFYIISRYYITENNLYVQYIQNGNSWLNYFENYELKILEVLDLNND